MGINTTSKIFEPRNMIEGLSPSSIDVGRADDLTQSIVDAAGINTYTLAHTATNSIMSIYSTDLTEYLLWDSPATPATYTTTLILDLGKRVYVHNTIIHFSMVMGAASAADRSVTTSYSNDNINFTQIDSVSLSDSNTTEIYYDHKLTKTRYRYLKIVYSTTHTSGDQDIQCRLRRVGLFR